LALVYWVNTSKLAPNISATHLILQYSKKVPGKIAVFQWRGRDFIVYLRLTIKEAAMAGRKTVEFGQDLIDLAEVAKALGHPGRLEILRILAGRACICGDIVDRMPLSQATVSQHLKELKKVGLIRGEIEGPRICYCLDTGALREAQEKFISLFDGLACCTLEGEPHEECG
jgi:ArsR family transcriptional regulator